VGFSFIILGIEEANYFYNTHGILPMVILGDTLYQNHCMIWLFVLKHSKILAIMIPQSEEILNK